MSVTKKIQSIVRYGELKASMFCCFLLFVDAGQASELSLAEAEARFLANAARLESGSITYRIEYFCPKNNLLGVFDHPGFGYEEMGYDSPPFFAAEEDVTLPGVGTFKWKGPKFAATTHHARLGNLPQDALQVQIGFLVDCWNGENLKSLLSVFPSSQDPFSGAVDLDVFEGPAILANGVILKKPRSIALSLGFLAAGPYCPTLNRKSFGFVSRFDSLTEENGLVRLTQASGRRVALLDPERACVPVQFRTESPLMPVVREIEYDLIEGTYFPISSVTTRFHNGNEVLSRITATLVSYEFNVDYPDSDFEYEFPEGVEVEDDAMIALEGGDSDE